MRLDLAAQLPLSDTDNYRGRVFTRAELPANIPAPVPAEEPAVAISKTKAREVAEQLSGRKCRTRDSRGCEIIVGFRSGDKSFIAPSWWLATRTLFAYLHKLGKAPEQTIDSPHSADGNE